MGRFMKLTFAVFVVSTVAAAAPAFAGGYYKGVSGAAINEGHRSERYNPPGKGVNHPPPRRGAYYKGVFRDK